MRLSSDSSREHNTLSADRLQTLVSELRIKGISFLSRREYSSRELRTRLQQGLVKAHNTESHDTEITEPELISQALDEVIERLQQENYLSDERFAEMLVNSRSRKGYGPRVVRQELAQQGIAVDIADSVLQRLAIDWEAVVADLVQRRYGRDLAEPKIQMKARQFLYRRGFDFDVIQICLKANLAE